MLEQNLKLLYHKRLSLCYFLFFVCLLAVTSVFVCFILLFLKLRPVQSMFFSRVIQMEKVGKQMFLKIWDSGCWGLVCSLWHLCLNIIKGKIAEQSVLFLDDEYNAMQATSCNTLFHLAGYKSKIFLREVSDEETGIFKWRFKVWKLTNISFVKKNILIR